MAKVSSPIRRGASESTATLPGLGVHRRAGRQRLGQGRRAVRFDPDDLGPGPRSHAAMPASSPPPPTLASTAAVVRRLPASSMASVPAPRMVSA